MSMSDMQRRKIIIRQHELAARKRWNKTHLDQQLPINKEETREKIRRKI